MQISADDIPPLLFMGAAALVGMVWLFCWMIISTNKTRERERSRREIAAYVAEGTIKPEDAEMLLAENSAAAEREKTKRTLAESVSEGTLTIEAAERILQADKPAWQRRDMWVCEVGGSKKRERDDRDGAEVAHA